MASSSSNSSQAKGQSDQVNDDPVQMAELFLRRHREFKENVMKIFHEIFKRVDDGETSQQYRNELQRKIEKAFQAKRLEDAVLQYTQEYEKSMSQNFMAISDNENDLARKLRDFFKHPGLIETAMKKLRASFQSDDDQTIKTEYGKKLRKKINEAFQKLVDNQLKAFEYQLITACQVQFPTLDNASDAETWFETFCNEKRLSPQWGPVITGWEKFREKCDEYGCANQVQKKEKELSKWCFRQQINDPNKSQTL